MIFFLSSCAIKQDVSRTQAVFMTIKTPLLKYSDSGFLKQINEAIYINLFNAGIPVLEIIIDKKVCIQKVCYNNLQFNSQFLGDMHYNNILKDIVLFRPIYNKKNLKYENKGFSQSLHVKNREIFYQVTNQSVTFRDKAKKVLIKIKLLRNDI